MFGTAVGFVLGALVGAIATSAGSYVVFRKREAVKTSRLRRAFTEELRAYEYVDDRAAAGAYEALTEQVERPRIYESTAGDLGLLEEDEIGVLVDFYTDLYWLDGLEDPEDKTNQIDAVGEKRREALDTLDRPSE